jgi:hypothetical protein
MTAATMRSCCADGAADANADARGLAVGEAARWDEVSLRLGHRVGGLQSLIVGS